MIIHCFSWINAVWEQLIFDFFVTKKYSFVTKKYFGSRFLPDELLIKILSNLPAESVLECRKVCKHWNALTSTPDFIEKHFNNATPAILIVYNKEQGRKLDKEGEVRVFIINEWAAAKGRRNVGLLKKGIKKLHRDSIFPVPLFLSQQDKPTLNCFYIDSLLLFMPQCPFILPCRIKSSNPLNLTSHILCNPVTREKIVLNTYGGTILTCFYHPLAREYRLIWIGKLSNASFMQVQILNLGSTREQLSWRRLADFNVFPRHSWPAVFLNNEALYWMMKDDSCTKLQPCCSESIIMFDINKEKFSSMPHPGNECDKSWRKHTYMYLLELKSSEAAAAAARSLLCLCDCSMQDQMDMWVLEDYKMQIWVRRHRIVMEMDIARFPFANDKLSYEVYPFGIHNGEILIHWKNRGVFAYHFDKGTTRKINEVIASGMGLTDDDIVFVTMHRKSLLPLTNLKHRGMYIDVEHKSSIE